MLVLLLLICGCLDMPVPSDSGELRLSTQNSSGNVSVKVDVQSSQSPTTQAKPEYKTHRLKESQKLKNLNVSFLWNFSTSEPVYDMDISNRYVALASYDNHFYVLSRSGELLYSLDTKGNAEAVSLSGELLAGASFVIPEATVYLYNLSTGRLVWKHTYGEHIRALDFVGDVLVIGSVRGRILALSLKGKKLWERHISKSAWGVNEVEGFGSRFCVAGDDTYLYLFTKDGDLIWKKAMGRKSYLYGCALSSKEVGFAAQDKKAGIFSLSGKKLWEFKTGFSNSDISISDSIVAVASWDGNVYLLSPKGRLLGRIPAEEPTCVVISGDMIGICSRDGNGYIYRIN